MYSNHGNDHGRKNTTLVKDLRIITQLASGSQRKVEVGGGGYGSERGAGNGGDQVG